MPAEPEVSIRGKSLFIGTMTEPVVDPSMELAGRARGVVRVPMMLVASIMSTFTTRWRPRVPLEPPPTFTHR
jgi:hypothetical protein